MRSFGHDACVANHALEHAWVLADGFVVGSADRESDRLPRSGAGLDSPQFVWICDRFGTEHQVVEHREQSEIDADAEGQREHRHGGEAGILQHLSRAITKILSQIFNPTQAALIAASLLDGFHPSELPQSRITRFIRMHPRINVLLRLHFNVRKHLVVHLRIKHLLLKQRAKSKAKLVKRDHAFNL